MRYTFPRLMTTAMVAGAALLVSACGGSDAPVDANAAMANAEEPAMEGSVNDVTAVDAAGASDNIVMDNAMAPDGNAADVANGAEAANATEATNAQ